MPKLIEIELSELSKTVKPHKPIKLSELPKAEKPHKPPEANKVALFPYYRERGETLFRSYEYHMMLPPMRALAAIGENLLTLDQFASVQEKLCLIKPAIDLARILEEIFTRDYFNALRREEIKSKIYLKIITKQMSAISAAAEKLGETAKKIFDPDDDQTTKKIFTTDDPETIAAMIASKPSEIPNYLIFAILFKSNRILTFILIFIIRNIYEISSQELNQALVYAAYTNNCVALQLLLKMPNLACNITDSNGFTPLMIAAMWGRYEACKLLLQAYKADESIKHEQYGVTALGFAIHNEHYHLLELFIKARAAIPNIMPAAVDVKLNR